MVPKRSKGLPVSKIRPVPYLILFNLIFLILSVSLVTPDQKSTEKRIIFLFSLSKNEPRLLTQLKFLSLDPEGQLERDILVQAPIMVTDISRDPVQKPEPSFDKFEIKYPVINIRNPFCVILVGKDGKEKLRSYEPVPLKKLFALIDLMPMRIEEMKMGHNP